MFEIVYQNEIPCGIRNEDGYLLFFVKIFKYPNQEERYSKEIKNLQDKANIILKILNEDKPNLNIEPPRFYNLSEGVNPKKFNDEAVKEKQK